MIINGVSTVTLRQDIEGAEWLEKNYPTKRMPKWNPRTGSYRWHQYGNLREAETEINAIFLKAPVDVVAEAIATVEPKFRHESDIGFQTVLADFPIFSILPYEILVFRLKDDPWCIVSATCHQQSDYGGFDPKVHEFILEIHKHVKCDVAAVSKNGSLEINSGRTRFAECHDEWDGEGAPSEWFEERGIFLPPYRCDVDESNHLRFWLAEVPVEEVEQIDLFFYPTLKTN